MFQKIRGNFKEIQIPWVEDMVKPRECTKCGGEMKLINLIVVSVIHEGYLKFFKIDLIQKDIMPDMQTPETFEGSTEGFSHFRVFSKFLEFFCELKETVRDLSFPFF